jgi:hypothetical protein
MVERTVSAAFRRGVWGGSPAHRALAIGILTVRGARKLVRREPEVVRRVKIRPGSAMSLAVRLGGRR